MAEIDLRGAILSLLGKLESKDNGILKYHPSSRINFELLREIVSQFENADQFKSAFKSMCLRTLNENPPYTILHKHALRMYIFGLNVILADLEHSFVDERPCATCNEHSDPDRTLLCDCCNDPYHTFCLALPDDIPSGTWFCRDCSVLEQNYLMQRVLSTLDRKQHPQQRVRQARKPVHVRISVSSSSEENDERAKRRANRNQRQAKKPGKAKRAARTSRQQSSSSSASSSYSSSSSDDTSASADWDQKQDRLLAQSAAVFAKQVEMLKQRQTRPAPTKPQATQSLRKSNRELQGEADALGRAIAEANAEIKRLDLTTNHLASRMQGLQSDGADHRRVLQQIADEDAKKSREIQLMTEAYQDMVTLYPDNLDIHAQLQQRLGHGQREAAELLRLRAHHETDLQHIERALRQLTDQCEKDKARMQALRDECQRRALTRDELFLRIQRQQEQVRKLTTVETTQSLPPQPQQAPLVPQVQPLPQPPLIQQPPLQQWPAQWEPRLQHQHQHQLPQQQLQNQQQQQRQQQQQQLPRGVPYAQRAMLQPERENPFDQQPHLTQKLDRLPRDWPQQRPFHPQQLADHAFRLIPPNPAQRDLPYARDVLQNSPGDFERHSHHQRDVLRDAYHSRDSYRPNQRDPYPQMREPANQQREFQPQRGLPSLGDHYDPQRDDRLRRDSQDRDLPHRFIEPSRPDERVPDDRFHQARPDQRDARHFNQHREQRTTFFRDSDERQHFDDRLQQRPFEHDRRDQLVHNGRREDYQLQQEQFSRIDLYDPDVPDEEPFQQQHALPSPQLRPVQAQQEAFSHKGPIGKEEKKLDRPAVVQPVQKANAASATNANSKANAPKPRPPANATGALVFDQTASQWRAMKRLLGRRLVSSKVQYKIDWGEPGREHAWASVEEMHNCEDIIKTFEQKHAAQLLQVSKQSGGKRKEH